MDFQRARNELCVLNRVPPLGDHVELCENPLFEVLKVGSVWDIILDWKPLGNFEIYANLRQLIPHLSEDLLRPHSDNGLGDSGLKVVGRQTVFTHTSSEASTHHPVSNVLPVSILKRLVYTLSLKSLQKRWALSSTEGLCDFINPTISSTQPIMNRVAEYNVGVLYHLGFFVGHHKLKCRRGINPSIGINVIDPIEI